MNSLRAKQIQDTPLVPSRGFAHWIGLLLFFMMLFVPTTYQEIKLGLLVLVFGAVFLSGVKKRMFYLAPPVAFWSALMIGTGLIFILIGVINGNPGALKVANVYTLWPAVFTLLICGITTTHTLRDLCRVLIVATIAISVYSLTYILNALGIVPDAYYIEINQGQGIGIYNGYIEYTLHNIASLNFLVPFSLSALFIWSSRHSSPITRGWVFVALILGTVLAFLSGRRALWIIIALSPFISSAFQLFYPRQIESTINRSKFKTLIGSIVLFGGFYVYLYEFSGVDVSAILNNFLLGFDFSDDQGAYARSSQAAALINGWHENFLLGTGHGAEASVIRSDNAPWSYELSYLALIFHTGSIGFLLYSSAVLWIYANSIAIIREGHPLSQYLIPIMVGLTCFLIANATNPYLEKFDYIWVIFLPVSVINIWKMNKRESSDKVNAL